VAWTATLDAPAIAAGVMDAERIYVPLDTGNLHAFDRETGERLWTSNATTVVSPAVAGAFDYTAGPDAVRRFDARTGGERSALALDSPAAAAPVFVQEMLVLATESGDVLGIRAEAGAIAWRRNVGSRTRHRPSVLEDYAVALTLDDSRVVVLDARSGEPLWERTLPGTLSAPAAARDRVFVGSTDNFFYAFDGQSGNERWRWRTGGDVVGAAAAEDRVYFISLDNILRCVNRDNGNQQWKAEAPTRPSVPPIPVGDVVVMAGIAPRLDGYVGKTGAVLGSYAATADLVGAPAIDANLQPFRVALAVFTRDSRVTALRPTRMMLPDPPLVPLLRLPGRELPPERRPTA
jgi:outer membrane protein assembly factor BamB